MWFMSSFVQRLGKFAFKIASNLSNGILFSFLQPSGSAKIVALAVAKTANETKIRNFGIESSRFNQSSASVMPSQISE